MPYIGNTSPSRFVSNRAASVYSGDGSTTAFTLEQAVVQDEDILVSVDGVVQEPSVAYAVSNGTTLTFTGAPSRDSGNNIFVYYLASQVGTAGPPNDSVSTNTLKDSAVTSAKLDISATNKPSFKAYLSSDQAQTQNSVTQIVYNTEIYDSDSAYNTSNGRFTPAVVGKYFVNASVGIDGADANGRIRVFLYKNGSSYAISSSGIGDTDDDGGVLQCTAIVELDADDYVDARVQYTGTDNVVGQQQKTWFEAFKLIGV